MYHTSNERDYYSLSTGIFFSENKHESKKRYREMYFLDLKFLIVHISTHVKCNCRSEILCTCW